MWVDNTIYNRNLDPMISMMNLLAEPFHPKGAQIVGDGHTVELTWAIHISACAYLLHLFENDAMADTTILQKYMDLNAPEKDVDRHAQKEKKEGEG